MFIAHMFLAHMYDGRMKSNAIVMTAAFAAVAAIAATNVSGASAVYIMPMVGGLDQYLALRLTTGSVMQVVTDPLKADVVLTDRVGSGFDDRWKELYPPPPAPKSDDKDKSKDKDEIFTLQRPTSQPLARSRGTIFLIDRSTRNVIWSMYALPKSTGSDDLNRIADQIAKELAKARKGKQ
jgi:hypothetical protein